MFDMKSLAEKLRSEQCARILAALTSGARTHAELVQATRLTAGSVTKHLDVLIQAGQVRRGRNDTYAVTR
jgi:DNA-binding IclR family transcriptional regulator